MVLELLLQLLNLSSNPSQPLPEAVLFVKVTPLQGFISVSQHKQ